MTHLDQHANSPLAGGVLIISPEAWDAHSVSKHHYARTLAARGSTVFFLNPPDDSLTELQIDVASDFAGVHVVSGPRVAAGLRFYPAFLRRWMEARWLSHFETVIGSKINVVWLFENSRFFDLRFATDRLKIYHQVDLNQNFHPASAAATADICFCTTDFIKSQLQPFNSRVYKIHHGLANHAGAQALGPGNPASLSQKQVEALHGAKVNAFCVGNLDMVYLDVGLLDSLIRQLPAVRFHFVGACSDGSELRTKCANLPNVAWWGKVASVQIPSLLNHADVLLLSYKADLHREQLASPHKLMEYFASGKIVVATYTDEYKDKRHLMKMVDDRESYSAAFTEVINNLEKYNSLDRQNARREFAQAHTYEKQLDKIIELLDQTQLVDN